MWVLTRRNNKIQSQFKFKIKRQTADSLFPQTLKIRQSIIVESLFRFFILFSTVYILSSTIASLLESSCTIHPETRAVTQNFINLQEYFIVWKEYVQTRKRERERERVYLSYNSRKSHAKLHIVRIYLYIYTIYNTISLKREG